jgi:hypothetical protein
MVRGHLDFPPQGRIFMFFALSGDLFCGEMILMSEGEGWRWGQQRRVAMDLSMESNIILFTDLLFGGITPPFLGLNGGATSVPTIFSPMLCSIFSRALSLYIYIYGSLICFQLVGREESYK